VELELFPLQESSKNLIFGPIFSSFFFFFQIGFQNFWFFWKILQI